jgi:DNA-binding MarR family transcriptional regulator
MTTTPGTAIAGGDAPARVVVPPPADAPARPGAMPLSGVVIELGRLVERRMHQAVRRSGVSASQYLVLLRVAGAPGISRADLARRLQISPQAVGGLTGQLVGKGLIERARAERSQAVAFTLTDLGCEVLDDAGPEVDHLVADMLRFFRPNLATAMDGGLRHLLDRL